MNLPALMWLLLALALSFRTVRVVVRDGPPPPFTWILPVGAFWAFVACVRAIIIYPAFAQ